MTWWVMCNFMRSYENIVFEASFEDFEKFMKLVSSFVFLKLEFVGWTCLDRIS
jgi:hypothetical protein